MHVCVHSIFELVPWPPIVNVSYATDVYTYLTAVFYTTIQA